MKRHAKLFTGELWGFGEGGFGGPGKRCVRIQKSCPWWL